MRKFLLSFFFLKKWKRTFVDYKHEDRTIEDYSFTLSLSKQAREKVKNFSSSDKYKMKMIRTNFQ